MTIDKAGRPHKKSSELMSIKFQKVENWQSGPAL